MCSAAQGFVQLSIALRDLDSRGQVLFIKSEIGLQPRRYITELFSCNNIAPGKNEQRQPIPQI